MGFFYQAIKRATGQPVEESKPEPSTAVSDVSLSASAAAVAIEAPPAVSIPTHVVSAPKQTFTLRGQIEKLVAFLTPPVLDQNIIAMEQCRVLQIGRASCRERV